MFDFKRPFSFFVHYFSYLCFNTTRKQKVKQDKKKSIFTVALFDLIKHPYYKCIFNFCEISGFSCIKLFSLPKLILFFYILMSSMLPVYIYTSYFYLVMVLTNTHMLLFILMQVSKSLFSMSV